MSLRQKLASTLSTDKGDHRDDREKDKDKGKEKEKEKEKDEEKCVDDELLKLRVLHGHLAALCADPATLARPLQARVNLFCTLDHLISLFNKSTLDEARGMEKKLLVRLGFVFFSILSLKFIFSLCFSRCFVC